MRAARSRSSYLPPSLTVLPFLTGPLQYLPRCVLAGIVFTIAVGMVDVTGLRDIRRESGASSILPSPRRWQLLQSMSCKASCWRSRCRSFDTCATLPNLRLHNTLRTSRDFVIHRERRLRFLSVQGTLLQQERQSMSAFGRLVQFHRSKLHVTISASHFRHLILPLTLKASGTL